MLKALKKLTSSVAEVEEKALFDFLAASTRRTGSARETESQLQLSLTFALRRLKGQA